MALLWIRHHHEIEGFRWKVQKQGHITNEMKIDSIRENAYVLMIIYQVQYFIEYLAYIPLAMDEEHCSASMTSWKF